ncbi:tetratricopeptide repeat protein [Pseudoroseomonas globiformis]|uniref:Tetratricopeptide repeat protein n=1 Tax=Teichococcus globiformis TaxID=2307229 RepID=A0ABV7G1R4_9PROT
MFRRRADRPAPPPSLPPAMVREASPETLDAAFAGPPEEAARWIAAAARAGMTQAQLIYGQILLDGRGVRQNRASALGWFRVAAGAGNLAALNMMGRCHELGWGTPQDVPQAVTLYREAASRGEPWAQYNLASLLARGVGVAPDLAEALLWFRRAAAQGHAKAMTVMARHLEEGTEGPPDHAAARTLYARAAEAGDVRAQFNMGTLALERGCEADALRWFRQAAAGGPADFRQDIAARLARRPEAAMQALAAELRQPAA